MSTPIYPARMVISKPGPDGGIPIGDVSNPFVVSSIAAASEAFAGFVGGLVTNPSANFNRPGDTNVYANGDLVANSTTAGQVAAMALSVGRIAEGSVIIRRLKLHKSSVSVTLAQFRVHLFRAAPTVANGDNGAFSCDGVANYLGAFDVTIDRAFTDGAAGFALPVIGSEQAIKLDAGQTIYALIQARAAYMPANAETFTVTLDNLQN